MVKIKEMKSIDYEGKRYFYEYKLAKKGDICLATKEPERYCNGVYRYSPKDSGSGKAFIVVGEECLCKNPDIYTDENGINYCEQCKVEVSLF